MDMYRDKYVATIISNNPSIDKIAEKTNSVDT